MSAQWRYRPPIPRRNGVVDVRRKKRERRGSFRCRSMRLLFLEVPSAPFERALNMTPCRQQHALLKSGVCKEGHNQKDSSSSPGRQCRRSFAAMASRQVSPSPSRITAYPVSRRHAPVSLRSNDKTIKISFQRQRQRPHGFERNRSRARCESR